MWLYAELFCSVEVKKSEILLCMYLMCLCGGYVLQSSYNKEAIFGFMQSCSCLSCRTWRHVHVHVVRVSSSHAHMSSAPGHVIRTLSAGHLHHSSWSAWA